MFLRNKSYFIILGLPVVASVVLFCLLNAFSPLDFGPMGILFVFVLLYLVIVGWFYALSRFVLGLLMKLRGIEAVPRSQLKRLYLIISILGLAPVFLLALNSIGQLGLGDFVLVIILLGVTVFYIARRRNL